MLFKETLFTYKEKNSETAEVQLIHNYTWSANLLVKVICLHASSNFLMLSFNIDFDFYLEGIR